MKLLEENRIYSKGLFEFLETKEEHVVDGENVVINRSMVRRPPGIRALIINNENQILLSKEFRYELDEWDYRLPGGKVFDSLDRYAESIKRNDVMDYVYKTVSREVLEEVGVEVKNPKLIKVSKDGASVVWDLYYFEIKEYEISKDGPNLEDQEFVNGFEFYSFDEIIDMCANNMIHEDRSIGVLLSYILKNRGGYHE